MIEQESPSGRRQEHVVEIDADREAVWRALTEAEELTRWYVEEARVEPGEEGEIWLSWGGEEAGAVPIRRWVPGQYLRLGAGEGDEGVVEEFFLEAREGGGTILRLVMSGVPEGADWDAFYDGTRIGWRLFLETLRHALERHPGHPRRILQHMEVVPLRRQEAWVRLLGDHGLRAGAALEGLRSGDRYRLTPASGQELCGEVRAHVPGELLALTVEPLDDAFLGAALHTTPRGTYAFVILSLFGEETAEQCRREDGWRRWLDGLFA